MVDRLLTGIRCIDERVSGFPKNGTTVIHGETGIGKTMFGLQFARTGLYTDERVGYFVAKDAPEQILLDVSAMGWDLGWAMEQDRFKIIDVKDYFWNATEEDLRTAYLPNFFQEVNRLIRTFNLNRVVIDPVIPLALTSSPEFYSRYVSELIRFFDNPALGVTSLLLHTERLKDPLFEKTQAPNLIQMFFTHKTEQYQRTLVIQKMKNTAVRPEEIYFDILHEQGLVEVS